MHLCITLWGGGGGRSQTRKSANQTTTTTTTTTSSETEPNGSDSRRRQWPTITIQKFTFVFFGGSCDIHKLKLSLLMGQT